MFHSKILHKILFKKKKMSKNLDIIEYHINLRIKSNSLFCQKLVLENVEQFRIFARSVSYFTGAETFPQLYVRINGVGKNVPPPVEYLCCVKRTILLIKSIDTPFSEGTFRNDEEKSPFSPTILGNSIAVTTGCFAISKQSTISFSNQMFVYKHLSSSVTLAFVYINTN